MSQENVETTRRAYAAFNDGDLGTVLAILDPDIEWNSSDVFFDQPCTYRGRCAWQEEFLRDLMQIFEEYRGEPEEFRDAGDQVVAVAQMGGTGRRSGAKVKARVAHVFTFRDGKIVRFTEFRGAGVACGAVSGRRVRFGTGSTSGSTGSTRTRSSMSLAVSGRLESLAPTRIGGSGTDPERNPRHGWERWH